MILSKCTFDQLPDAMQMHVLYCEKITVSEYRLAIWSDKNALYYNELEEDAVKAFTELIESKDRFLDDETMDNIYDKYGFAVCKEIHDAHGFLVKKELDRIAERAVKEYMPIIEKAMD